MSNIAIPYYDLLIRLVLYQKDLAISVQFRFQSQGPMIWEKPQTSSYIPFDPDTPTQVVVYPVLFGSTSMETLPLFNFPSLDPIRLWLDYDYAALIEGSLAGETGVFVLTEKTLGLDLIQHGW